MTFDREVYRARRQFKPINWVVRHMQASDDAAYHDLIAKSPEIGLVTIGVTYREGISPFEIMTRKQGQQVFMVEVPPDEENAGKVVASGACDPRMVFFAGEPTQAVHLHSLLVDPAYRHKGIATKLVQARINWARDTYGPDVLIFAEIHQDDMAAFKAGSKWATDFTQPRESGFLPTRKEAPQNPKNYVVREAQEADYAEIVAGINFFNHDIDFTRVVDYDRLHRNLAAIRGNVFRHRYVVLSEGKIVGGAVLSEHDPSLVTKVIHAPLLSRIVAQLSGMIHTDGEIKGGEVDGIWFKPGFADASHYLVQHLLYDVKNSKEPTEALNFTISNPKVWEAVQISHWQPHTILCVAYLATPSLQQKLEAVLQHA